MPARRRVMSPVREAVNDEQKARNTIKRRVRGLTLANYRSLLKDLDEGGAPDMTTLFNAMDAIIALLEETYEESVSAQNEYERTVKKYLQNLRKHVNAGNIIFRVLPDQGTDEADEDDDGRKTLVGLRGTVIGRKFVPPSENTPPPAQTLPIVPPASRIQPSQPAVPGQEWKSPIKLSTWLPDSKTSCEKSNYCLFYPISTSFDAIKTHFTSHYPKSKLLQIYEDASRKEYLVILHMGDRKKVSGRVTFSVGTYMPHVSTPTADELRTVVSEHTIGLNKLHDNDSPVDE